jgi:hypothetical protein
MSLVKFRGAEEHPGDSEEDPIYIDDESEDEEFDDEEPEDEHPDDELPDDELPDDEHLEDKHPEDEQSDDEDLINFIRNYIKEHLNDNNPKDDSNNKSSKDDTAEYIDRLNDEIMDLESQLALEREGRAQAEDLYLRSHSRPERSPSPEPRAARPPTTPSSSSRGSKFTEAARPPPGSTPRRFYNSSSFDSPIRSPSSRGVRFTGSARPPTPIAPRRFSNSRSSESRVHKKSPPRRRLSFTFTSIRRRTFGERIALGAWRQRWLLMGVALGAAWKVAPEEEMGVVGTVFVGFLGWTEGLW